MLFTCFATSWPSSSLLTRVFHGSAAKSKANVVSQQSGLLLSKLLLSHYFKSFIFKNDLLRGKKNTLEKKFKIIPLYFVHVIISEYDDTNFMFLI